MQGPGILYDDLKEVFGQERDDEKLDELLLDESQGNENETPCPMSPQIDKNLEELI